MIQPDLKMPVLILDNYSLMVHIMDDTNASEIVKILSEDNKTLSIAESITGGLLSSSIVDISGASKVYRGGVTAYMLSVKDSVLGIPILETAKTGGVDENTSIKMAKNISRLMDTDYSISTTGIAERWDERPNQAFISVYDRNNVKVETKHIVYKDNDTRHYIRNDVVFNALVLLRKML